MLKTLVELAHSQRFLCVNEREKPLFVVFVALTLFGVFGNTSGSTFPLRALGFYWSMSEPIRQAVITFRHATSTEACDWL